MKSFKGILKYVLIVISVLIICVVLYIAIVTAYICSSVPKDIPFNKAEWQAKPEERIRMVYDMLSEYNDLEGMTRDEVIAALGEDYLDEYSNENLIIYNLGFGGLYSDPYTLDIKFENGVVTDVVVLNRD